MEIIHLGNFTVKSGRINISDPCYSNEVACRGDVLAVNGEWACHIAMSDEGSFGRKITRLSAWSIDIDPNAEEITRRIAPFTIGVDSGSVGIFDFDQYPPQGSSFGTEDNGFFSKCHSLVAGEDQAGIVEIKDHKMGVVSRSGFGNGGYKAMLWENEHGRTEEIEIAFIFSEG